MEPNLFTNRLAELERENERLHQVIEANSADITRIKDALALWDELSGAKRPSSSTQVELATPSIPETTAEPSVTTMILAILNDAMERKIPGMVPSDIHRAALRKGWNPHKATLRSRLWTMNSIENKLDKVPGTALYRMKPLPGMPYPGDEKPADLLSSGEQSAGSVQPAGDGEPVQEVAHDNID